MKILSFGVDFKSNNFEIEYVLDEEEFFNKIIFKDYKVLIINFYYLSSFLEVKNYFKGEVIFFYHYVDEMIYKKALEVGDYFYTFDEIWKLDFRLKHLSKKLNQKDIFIFNDLIFNLKTKELYKNRELIKLSPAKKEILKLLIENKNRFISKEYILENTKDIDKISSIKVLISKLRQLGFEIENQKDVGYKLIVKENT